MLWDGRRACIHCFTSVYAHVPAFPVRVCIRVCVCAVRLFACMRSTSMWMLRRRRHRRWLFCWPCILKSYRIWACNNCNSCVYSSLVSHPRAMYIFLFDSIRKLKYIDASTDMYLGSSLRSSSFSFHFFPSFLSSLPFSLSSTVWVR